MLRRLRPKAGQYQAGINRRPANESLSPFRPRKRLISICVARIRIRFPCLVEFTWTTAHLETGAAGSQRLVHNLARMPAGIS